MRRRDAGRRGWDDILPLLAEVRVGGLLGKCGALFCDAWSIERRAAGEMLDVVFLEVW